MHISFVCSGQSLYFCTFLFTHSFLACLHWVFISFCSVLYSVTYLSRDFCLLCIIQRISSHNCHFFLHLPLSFGMILFADIKEACLSPSHIEVPFTLCPSYIIFSLTIYFSFQECIYYNSLLLKASSVSAFLLLIYI